MQTIEISQKVQASEWAAIEGFLRERLLIQAQLIDQLKVIIAAKDEQLAALGGRIEAPEDGAPRPGEPT